MKKMKKKNNFTYDASSENLLRETCFSIFYSFEWTASAVILSIERTTITEECDTVQQISIVNQSSSPCIPQKPLSTVRL